jgi:general secretion pathway protein L
MQFVSAHLLAQSKDAWRWWTGELCGLVPQSLCRVLAGGRGRLLLIVEAGGAYVAYESGTRREALGRIDLEAPDSGGLAAALGRGRSENAITVRLPPEDAWRSTVALPIAAEKNLEQVIGYEFERLTPFRRDDVFYAHRILRRDTTAQRIHVELSAVPRKRAEQVLSFVRRAGSRVVALEVEGPDVDGKLPNLLPAAARPTASRPLRLAFVTFAGLAVLLALSAGSLPFIDVHERIAALTERLDAAKRDSQVSLALQKQIDAELQDREFLVTRKRQTRSVTEILASLTHLLSDDTWLLMVQITGGQVRISGFSPSATALLGVLAQSPIYADPGFTSSVTQDTASKRERFDIAARIVARDAH